MHGRGIDPCAAGRRCDGLGVTVAADVEDVEDGVVIDPCRKCGGSVGGREAGRFRDGRELVRVPTRRLAAMASAS